MELLHPHCAGLDIYKETVVACVRHLRSGKVTTGIKTFKTTTEELIGKPPLALAASAGVGQGQGGFVSNHSTAIQKRRNYPMSSTTIKSYGRLL
jgi:hypothetical protein